MADLRVAVVGTGSWGTTLAVLLAETGLPTTLWARTPQEAEQLNAARENAEFVPGFCLYRHEDVIGVELGGALKNIIAIAAGATKCSEGKEET